MATSKDAIKRYDSKHKKTYAFNLYDTAHADIIDHLANLPNGESVNAYLRRLVSEDMQKLEQSKKEQ